MPKNTLTLASKRTVAIGNLVRQNAHRLNNLILVVQGNLDLILESQGNKNTYPDVMRALKECREIAGRLLEIGRSLSYKDTDK